MSDSTRLPTTDTADERPTSAKRRHRSWGELWFDAFVYGGIGWVINTLISAAAADQFFNGAWKKGMESTVNFFDRQLTPLIKNPATRSEWAETSFFISTLYTGGCLLVIPIRWLEGKKSSIVRSLDRWIHGPKADSDPKLAAMHQAMDNAPQQSWQSLTAARILALPAGLGLGWIMGKDNAYSTKLLAEKPFTTAQAHEYHFFSRRPLTNYTSFARAGINLTRDLAARFFPSMREEVAAARLASPTSLMETERRSIKIGFYLLYDLLLSAVVATGFYLSSKVFASWKKHHDDGKKPIQPLFGKLTYIAADTAESPGEQASTETPTSPENRPTTRIQSAVPVHDNAQSASQRIV